MVQINFAQKSVNVKIVYYGPGMSGKTTNLEVVHQRAPDGNRGDLTSISTDGDRTLFFDYMPLHLGTVAGMKTCFQVYTVPGQVYYNSTRKLVLQGVDGVIFVADSSPSMMEQNLESLRNLEENLNEYGKNLASLPHVIQYNKRDLPDALPIEDLERNLNPHGAETFEAVANTGQGVFPTLKALAASVLKTVMQEASGGGGGVAAPSPAPGVAQTPAAPAGQSAPGTPAAPQAPPTPQAPAAPAPAGQGMPGAAAPMPMAAEAAPQQQAPQPTTQMGPQPGELPGGPAPAAPGGVAPGQVPVQNPYADAAPASAPQPQVATAPAQSQPGLATQGATELMKTGAQGRPASRSRARAHSVPAKPQKAPAKTPTGSGGGAKTLIFVTVAAGVGAALAYVVLNVL